MAPTETETPMSAPAPFPSAGGLARVIAHCAAHPVMTVAAVFVLFIGGLVAIDRTALDAIPDLSETQVVIVTTWEGRSPDQIEDQITFPLSSALVSAPNIQFVRGQSFFGLSFVYAIFEEGTDLYWARSRVLEVLNTVQSSLPSDAKTSLGPDATGVGWVYQYALVDTHRTQDLAQLRTLQDWTVRYALASVPGVAEVASIGGAVKAYQVDVDPTLLRAYDVTIEDVRRAIRASNEDSGGRVIEIAGHEHMIRGRGDLKTLDDIRQIPVAISADGVPITVDQVAETQFGPQMRRGLAELNGEGEVVGGIVVMRSGNNALNVIENIKARIAELEPTLPDGVKIVPTYDRSTLVNAVIDTLSTTLVEEMVVVSLIILLFLLHVRSALIPVLTLPIAVVLAFVPMAAQGITANIMSLGGIAVAIGAMVDASIIMIENVHRALDEWRKDGERLPRTQVVVRAMQEVGPSVFFSLLVITVSFLPIFTLEAVEGRLFRPLALTKTYAMGFSALLAVTLTPALIVLLIRGRTRPEADHPLNRFFVWAYTPVVRLVVKFRWWTVAIATTVMLATVPVVFALGSEFMPPLNEGAVLYMPTAPPGMSITEAARVVQVIDRRIKTLPEVQSVFGKMGRAQTATDPAPIGMGEITVALKPRSEWRDGMTYAALIDEMDAALQIPGMPNLWWMPIQTRTEMLATGVRTPLAVQIFGDSLERIEAQAIQIEHALRALPGTKNAFAERSTGGFYLDFELDRAAAARLGVQAAAVSEAVQAAIGGQTVGEVIDKRARFPISVRYGRDFRDNVAALEDVLVTTLAGAQIPITDVATIVFKNGPPMIRSEDGQLSAFVFIDPGETPISTYVDTAKKSVATLDLKGTRLQWVGQYQSLQRAADRLTLILPATLLLVLLLLYLNTRSLTESLIVLLAVPFSLVGAAWLLFVLDYNLSVAVWVGVIALAGLDAETGVVMLLYLNLAWKKAELADALKTEGDRTEAIVDGAARRVRPKLMTVATTLIGLSPVMWSTGAGADVMKRIAAPMVGGLVTSFALELLVYPALFAIWRSRSNRRER